MVEAVPDEILADILIHALNILENTFETRDTVFAFASTPRSTDPDILLVSRRWHAVGLPVLYESAILRTGHQVNVFCRAIKDGVTGSATPGKYLRRLRIEAGYHKLAAILEAVPAIHTMFLGLSVWRGHEVQGLREAVQTINPARLMLDYSSEPTRGSPYAQEILTAIAAGIPQWTNFKRLDVSYGLMHLWSVLEAPLQQAPSLQHVSFFYWLSAEQDYLLYMGVLDLIWATLSEIPSLQVIQVRIGGTDFLPWKNLPHAVLQKLYMGEGENMFPASKFLALNTEAGQGLLLELPDKVWHRILGFAMHVGYPECKVMDDGQWKTMIDAGVVLTRRRLLLVNKKFYPLALSHYYSMPLITRPSEGRRCLKQAEVRPEIGSLIRVLYAPESLWADSDSNLRVSVHLPNLVRVNRPFELSLLHRTNDGDGEDNGLLALEWMEQDLLGVMIIPFVLTKFSRLRTAIFHNGRAHRDLPVPLDALPYLEVLHLWDCDESLFEVFCEMRFPSLREVGAIISPALVKLLSAHGAKLEVLTLAGHSDGLSEGSPVLDLCPNVRELHLRVPVYPPRPPSDFTPSNCIPSLPCQKPSTSIRTLRLEPMQNDRKRHREHKEKDPVWDALVDYVAQRRTSHFPALEEVRISSRNYWPPSESEYRTSGIARAALGLHNLGVHFASLEGVRWARFTPLVDWMPEKGRAE